MWIHWILLAWAPFAILFSYRNVESGVSKSFLPLIEILDLLVEVSHLWYLHQTEIHLCAIIFSLPSWISIIIWEIYYTIKNFVITSVAQCYFVIIIDNAPTFQSYLLKYINVTTSLCRWSHLYFNPKICRFINWLSR